MATFSGQKWVVRDIGKELGSLMKGGSDGLGTSRGQQGTNGQRKVDLVTTSSSRAKQWLRSLSPNGPMPIAKVLDMDSQPGHCLTSVIVKELGESKDRGS